MIKLFIQTTGKDEVIDITEKIEGLLKKQTTGLCFVFALHTTCAVTTADLDPGTDLDMLDALRSLIPNLNFRHPHDPKHVPDHILSSIIGPGVIVPFEKGKLVLGTWQRVVLVEFSGPRKRVLLVEIIEKFRNN